MRDVQTVLPGLGTSSLNEPGSGHGVLAFISIKQWQIGQPLESVMHHEDLLEVDVLLIGHSETNSFLVCLNNIVYWG